MKRIGMVPALLTLSLAVSACETTKRTAEFIPTPANRLVCDRAGTRPAVPKEYVIDWAHVATVAQAKSEHLKFVAVLRTRENIVAGYVVVLEGVNFACFNNMKWRKEFEADLARSHAPTP